MNHQTYRPSRPPMMPSALADFASAIMRNAEDIGRNFTRPDSDWTMMFFAMGGHSPAICSIILSCPEDKDRLPAALTDIVRKTGATRTALITSCWMVETKTTNPAAAELTVQACNEFGVSNHPERFEVLQLGVADAPDEWREWSQSECASEVYQAKITRHADTPPTLGEWVKQPGTQPGTQWTGRMARICARALANGRE